MKRIPEFSLLLLIVNTVLLVYLVLRIYSLSDNQDIKPALLPLEKKSQQRAMAEPLPNDATAEKFVKDFHSKLDGSAGVVNWPKAEGKWLKSWAIKARFLKNIIDKLPGEDINTKYIRIYPVINDKGNFSMMYVGEFEEKQPNGTILRKLLRPVKEQRPTGPMDNTPMYEWLDPCPPYDCPKDDFEF